MQKMFKYKLYTKKCRYFYKIYRIKELEEICAKKDADYGHEISRLDVQIKELIET